MMLLTMLRWKMHQRKMHQVRRKAPQAASHHENVVLLQKPRGARERTESVMTVAVAEIAVVATTTATVVTMIAIATTTAVTTAVTTTNTAATTTATTVATTIAIMIAIIAVIIVAAVTRDPPVAVELLPALASEAMAEVVGQYMWLITELSQALLQVPLVLVTEAATVDAVVDVVVVLDMGSELPVELSELVSVLEPSILDWEQAAIVHVEPRQPFIMYH